MNALHRWLDARQPPAPPALRTRLGEPVDAHPEWESLAVPDALLSAGEQLLQGVLRAPSQRRATAVDLLAADACVTYAFEAAADAPERLVALAELSMRRIAQLAAPA